MCNAHKSRMQGAIALKIKYDVSNAVIRVIFNSNKFPKLSISIKI